MINPPQLDRSGQSYAEVLQMQRSELEIWSSRLRPSLFNEIKAYCLSHNTVGSSKERHQVFRGGDIPAIARVWPEVPPWYPARKDQPVESVI